MSTNEDAPDAAALPPQSLFANPNVQIGFSILLSAAAQVLLKLGAGDHAETGGLGLGGLQSPWVWGGIAAMIASLFSWLYALRFMPLSLAFTLSGAIHALVPLASWLCLGETISAKRWLGIALVVVGVVASARPATAVEEKL